MAPLFAADSPKYPSEEISFDSLKFQSIPQLELPSGVYFWKPRCEESNDDPAFKGKVTYLDLNADGCKEILIESECKGDDQYDFWQERDGRWVCLLTVSGKPDFLKKRNGYFQVTVWHEYRGKGVRELYTYEGERYHITRMDGYDGDSYVGPQDTKDREKVLEWNFSQQFHSLP